MTDRPPTALALALALALLAHAAPHAHAHQDGRLPPPSPGGTIVDLLTDDADTTEQASPDDIRRARAARRLADLGRVEADLADVDASLVEVYRDTVFELASERMGGRAPGTEGIALAADLIETRFRALGLDPLFTAQAADAAVPSYRQPFERGNRTLLHAASLALDLPGQDPAPLALDQDFTVLGLSGSGDFSGPVTFVGYSIVSGPGGYLNYAPQQDLAGRAALMLRFEPMGDDGSSRWGSGDWSFNAALQAKVGAAARRNASAVLLVNPPGADDPRAGRLENIDSTEGPMSFEIPVLMITPEVAARLVAAGDPEGRTLEHLTALANDAGTVIPFNDHARISASARMERAAILTDNVGAILPGRGSLAGEYVVIGAHYDHIGDGSFASRSPDRAGHIHRGADDNASGTAGLLLAAEALADDYAALPHDADARSILFLAFSAEESGLNGSRYYVENPPVPIDDTVAMINMDMIGRLRNGRLEIGGYETSPDLEALALARLRESGFVTEHSTIGRGRSDHASFEGAGVPNLFLHTGLHDEYHTADDTPDLVNAEGGALVALTAADIALDLATRGARPEHASPDRRGVAARARPTVRIGIVPGEHPDGGFVVERLFDDTSASDAGLRVGDRVLAWDAQPVDSVEDWTTSLLDHSPGDVVTLTIERDGEEMELDMTLKAP